MSIDWIKTMFWGGGAIVVIAFLIDLLVYRFQHGRSLDRKVLIAVAIIGAILMFVGTLLTNGPPQP